MRIRFEELSPQQRAGGIEVSIAGLTTALQEQNFIVSRASDAPKSDEEGALPNCVHFHGIWSPSLAKRFLAWKRLGIPCLLSPHGMLEPWAFAHKRLKKQAAWHLYQRRLLNRASALHATSPQEAENMDRLGLRSKIEVIPWGVEMPSSSSVSASGDSAFPFRTALFVGRIHPIKALPVLVAAWATVRPGGWKMKIVGPDYGGHRAEVEAQVRQAGLEESFEFVGPMDRESVQQAYRDADLFILPSYTENFGMVVAEALACGVPVIASHGVPWESLASEGGGWWVEGSVEGIGEALKAADDCSVERLQAIGAAGRRLVEEKYSWQAIGSSFAALYREICRIS